MDGFQRIYDAPHYFNATWIIFVVFAFIAIDALLRKRPNSVFAPLLIPAHATALAVVTFAALAIIHHDGGTKLPGYGTNIADQFDATRQIVQVDNNCLMHPPFSQWDQYPWEFTVLRNMMAEQTIPQPGFLAIVHYRGDFPSDAHITTTIVPDTFPTNARP